MIDAWEKVAQEFGGATDGSSPLIVVYSLAKEIIRLREERNRFKELYEDYSQEVDELQLERNQSRASCARLRSALDNLAVGRMWGLYESEKSNLLRIQEFCVRILITSDGQKELDIVKEVSQLFDRISMNGKSGHETILKLRDAFGLDP